MSEEAAQAILRLDFDDTARKRMNELAGKNRAGRLSAAEDEELENYIHVGHMLGTLKSKARKALRSRP